MYNKYVALFGISVFLALSCGSTKHKGKSHAMPGTWQATPITIDGDSKDWPSPYPNYDARALIAYATSNDKENLYITVETGDELTQMKILKQGMTVSIDTGGKKDPQFMINYPLQNESDPIDLGKKEDGLNKNGDPMRIGRAVNKSIMKAVQEANQYSLEGFGLCNGGYMVSQTSACGIKVIVKMDEYKELVWEAVIPFKAFYNKETITKADADRTLSVCFAVKSFKHDTKSTDNANGGMNNGGMGGGGMKGSMRGGGGGGKGGGRAPAENPLQHLYESTKTWKQFGLAYQP